MNSFCSVSRFNYPITRSQSIVSVCYNLKPCNSLSLSLSFLVLSFSLCALHHFNSKFLCKIISYNTYRPQQISYLKLHLWNFEMFLFVWLYNSHGLWYLLESSFVDWLTHNFPWHSTLSSTYTSLVYSLLSGVSGLWR